MPDATEPVEARPALGLIVFFLIAFGVPWTCWIVLRRTMSLDHMFDSFSTYWFTAAPSFAGFAAAFAADGFTGLKRFATRVFTLRFSLLLWIAALFLPLLAALLTFLPRLGDLAQGGAPKFAKLVAIASLMNFFTGPLAEEFGWRGYLLGRFCRRLHPALAGLAIGPIWAAWHIPIFYDGVFAHVSSTLGFLAWTTSWSVVLALIVARARGSVLPSILGHWTINAAPAIFFALLPALPGEKQPGGLSFAIASVAMACAMTWLWRDTKWQPRAAG
jgi:membrane protease YdiL (CAAX protease family)